MTNHNLAIREVILETIQPLKQKVDNLELKVDNLELKVDNLELKVDNLELSFERFKNELTQENRAFKEEIRIELNNFRNENRKFRDEMILENNKFKQDMLKMFKQQKEELEQKLFNALESIDRKFEMLFEYLAPMTQQIARFEKHQDTLGNHEMRITNVEHIIRSKSIL